MERDRELAVLDGALAAAQAGSGRVVVLDAARGMGKSRLLTAAADNARERGMEVLSAAGNALERDFRFGVAIQLFEPYLHSLGHDERTRICTGPAQRAWELMAGELAGPASAGDEGYGVIHGLYRLVANMVSADGDGSNVPLVIVVDDLHGADRPSLRFLAYLAKRIAELPVLLIASVHPGERAADQQALLALSNPTQSEILRPGPLTDDGVAVVIDSYFSDADHTFCQACANASSGNPFLLTALLEQIRSDCQSPDTDTASSIGKVVPAPVLASVETSLEAMPESPRAVASAVSILHVNASLERVSLLTGLDIEDVSEAADALTAVQLLNPGTPLSFVHPLIASAIREAMPPIDHARTHRRAATILSSEGATDETVAAHLLSAAPEFDPSAVEVLRASAQTELASGSVDAAVRMLERALAEDPPAVVRAELLAELGQAQLLADDPRGVERLDEAVEITDELPRKARLALLHGQALYRQARFEEAAAVLKAVLDELDEVPDGLDEDIEAAYIAAASAVPALAATAYARSRMLLERLDGEPTRAQRAALSHLALQRALQGEDRASIAQLVDLAWGDGALAEADLLDGLTWPVLTGALLFVDELERDLEICDAVQAAEDGQDSSLTYPAASYCRAWARYEQGRILEAAADAHAALDARPAGWRGYIRTAYGAIACCHILRDELEDAETALSIIDSLETTDRPRLPFLLDVRAQLRLAQHRPEEALRDALEAGRCLRSMWKTASPGAVAWRSTAALAHLALGEPDKASALAAEELELARRIGATRVVIRDLRILGLADRDGRGLELLAEAVEIGQANPPRLEYIHALVDFGAALRRSNQRSAAREPLRKALELSHAGGVTVLAERARTELAATGSRPRRAMLSGVESLTPSELRVAELAAQGLTTRQMAETLFVTPKTIEFHLRHIYQKLDVRSRAELAEALPAEGGGSSAAERQLRGDDVAQLR